MTTLFQINFRREAYLRELARARRRVIALGVWVGYFGVMALMLGLYGLNCAALTRRTGQVERQAARIGKARAQSEWRLEPGEVVRVERYVLNPRLWRDRLVRLSQILPPEARITKLVVNPTESSNPIDENMLVITGEVRATGQERMQSVMRVVQALHSDSVFSSSYRNIKLGSTRVYEGAHAAAEFTIECR